MYNTKKELYYKTMFLVHKNVSILTNKLQNCAILM